MSRIPEALRRRAAQAFAEAEPADLSDFLCESRNDAGGDSVSAAPGQRLAAELEQQASILGLRAHPFASCSATSAARLEVLRSMPSPSW